MGSICDSLGKTTTTEQSYFKTSLCDGTNLKLEYNMKLFDGDFKSQQQQLRFMQCSRS